MADNRIAGSLPTSSKWSFLPKSVSSHFKPSSNPRSSNPDIENAPPQNPNIHNPRNQSVSSKSTAYKNQMDSPNCRSQVSASRPRAISALKTRNEVEEEGASNPHVKVGCFHFCLLGFNEIKSLCFLSFLKFGYLASLWSNSFL
jgi:kinesin family protein 15